MLSVTYFDAVAAAVAALILVSAMLLFVALLLFVDLQPFASATCLTSHNRM